MVTALDHFRRRRGSFPKLRFGSIFMPKYYSSFVRVISLFFDVVRYEKYFARRHEVRGFAARVSSRVCPRTVRASFRELFLLPAYTYLTGILLTR